MDTESISCAGMAQKRFTLDDCPIQLLVQMLTKDCVQDPCIQRDTSTPTDIQGRFLVAVAVNDVYLLEAHSWGIKSH